MACKLLLQWKGKREERPLQGKVLRVGRDPANELVVDPAERSVSQFHARFELDGDDWRVVDTRSTNGVRVNGQVLAPGDAGARVLADGDTLILGELGIRFVREASDRIVLEPEKRGQPRVTETLLAVSRMEDLPALITIPPVAALPREAVQSIERAKKALGVFAHVGGRITALTPLEDLVNAVLDLVFEATPAERAAVLLWDDAVGRLVPKRARTRGGGDPVFTVSETLVQRAFTEKVVVQMDPQGDLSASMQNLHLRSGVAVPMVDEGRALGVIYADTSLLTGAFDPFSVALLSALASHTALVLGQLRLLRKVRDEERKRARLERYLARSVVDRILAGEQHTTSGFNMRAEEVEITVLFCDMAGFTSRTEEMPPYEVLLLLNHCFGRMTEAVQEQGGTVDKYIGDCLMAVFGAPEPQPDHAQRAARAGLAIRTVIEGINAEGPTFDVKFRIGMHSGRAVAGDVGHVTRREWTVLGSTVNLASRLESSVARPGQIVLTEETRIGLGEEFEVRPIEVSGTPKGIRREFRAYELIGRRSS